MQLFIQMRLVERDGETVETALRPVDLLEDIRSDSFNYVIVINLKRLINGSLFCKYRSDTILLIALTEIKQQLSSMESVLRC